MSTFRRVPNGERRAASGEPVVIDPDRYGVCPYPGGGDAMPGGPTDDRRPTTDDGVTTGRGTVPTPPAGELVR
jgi:hypothetical protein